jgi:hypothetical protein
MRKLVSVTAVAVMLVLSAVVAGVASASDQPGSLTATVTIDGRDVSTAATGAPIRLVPGQTVDVNIALTNNTAAPVEVRQVQLDARVLGLTFFSYVTGVNLSAAPHSTTNVDYRLELSGLTGQATGLLSGAVSLRDHRENTILVRPTVIDVRGSLMSVYGLFGLVIVVLTALSLLDTSLAMARHRLPIHRWHRAIRLMIPGVGIGLVAAFSASAARLWVADTHTWLLAAGLCAAAMFAVGYLSPTPDPDDDAVDAEIEAGDLAVTDVQKLVCTANPTAELHRE